MTEYQEVDYTPPEWVERTKWWPDLVVYPYRKVVPVETVKTEHDTRIEQLLETLL